MSRRQAVAYVLPGFPVSKLIKVRVNDKIKDELIKLDEMRVSPRLKVGMLYMRRGQRSEEEVFGNREGSPAFDKFLDLIGRCVKLKGFEGFNGGLDIRHGNMGEYSCYAQTRGFDIMFHVSTLLPFSERDPQQIQRKSHIGNDIVCVVFLDESTPGSESPSAGTGLGFDPAMVRSHYLTVFIVVSPWTMNGTEGYRVSVATQQDVPAFGPSLPPAGFFVNASQLHDFLLAKIINAENAAFKSPKFLRLHSRTRTMFLDDLVQTYI
ncbi:hypothetical protein BC828DRAFT_344290, partial [Blastocladiella britannica]